MSTLLENNIVFGGQKQPGVTRNAESLGQFILEQLQDNLDKILLINGVSGEEVTGRNLLDRVIRLVSCLKELNVGEGDVIGICSENRSEFPVIIFAAFCLNAAVASFNVTYTERELQHALNLSSPKIVFTSETALERISTLFKRNSFIEHVFIFSDKYQLKGVKSFSKFVNNSKVNTLTNFRPNLTNVNTTVALIMCSSGTTGLAKGVQLTHRNIMSTIDDQFVGKLFIQEAVVMSTLPWFHAYGCLSMILISLVGSQLVFLPKFEEKSFLKAIQDYKVNVAFVVPPLMVFLAKSALVGKYDLSSLLALMCGAAPLSKKTLDAVRNRIGVQVIRQGYGLSESTLSLLVQTDECNKDGSVGSLKAGLYAKVIDIESKQPLGPNQRGELCFKGDVIMKGYIGDENATKDAIDEDGWFHTGDVGYYDNDLEFFIVDRIKELIKYKAYQVPPAEIESLLLTHPKIKDAAVIGLPDESVGELPFAFIVNQPNVKLTAKEVIDFVAENASPAKRLRGGVKFVKEIPKNPSGKILRRVLKETLKKMSIHKSKL